MEKLIKTLTRDHNLEREKALEAIRIVTDFLKGQHPEMEKLIESVIKDNQEILSSRKGN